LTEEQTSIVEQAFLLLARLRVERAAYAESRVKGWLTVSEAAAWIGFGRKFILQKMQEGRLWFQRCGGRGGGEVRIPRAHLDEQMALGFPRLNGPSRVCLARPLKELIPGPERPGEADGL